MRPPVVIVVSAACLVPSLAAGQPKPEEARAAKAEGDARYGERKFSEALAAYEKATKLDPGYLDGWDALGNLHYEQKNYAKAIESYQGGVSASASYTLGLYNIAFCYGLISQPAKAAEAYRGYLSRLPGDADGLWGLAESLAAAKDASALAAYEEYLSSETRPDKAAQKEKAQREVSARKAAKPAEKPAEKVAEKPAEKPSEKPADKGAKGGEKSTEKPAEKAAEKPTDKGAKGGEKPAASTEKTAEPPLNVVSAKGGETSSNAAEKPAEKPAASTEKPAAAAEKTAENTAGTSQAQQHKQDGDAFFFQGSYKEAADAYKKAVGVDPRYLDGWDALGNAYVALNDYAQAADAYKRGLEVDPSYTLGHYNLGYCYRALSSFDQAATSYRTYLLQAPNDPDALFGLGSSLAAAGRNDEAIKAFQDYLAHESRPEASAFAKSAAAELERLKSGKPAEASKAPGEGASKDIPLPGTAREALGQGDTAFQTKNYEDAAALYAQAVSIASNNVEARYKLGVTRALLRDYPGAVEHLSRALESDPKNSAIRERLNRVWQLAKAERKNELYTGTLPFAPSAEARSNGERAITEGRYAMALSYFDAALSYDPKDASAHKGRGDALLSLSRSEEAKEEYLYALSLAPREALPYRALGDLYRLRGDKKQARYYYDLFLLRAAPGTVPAEELAAVRAYLAKK